MKFTISVFTFLLSFGSFSTSLKAAQIYFLFDYACMDRLEYSYENAPSGSEKVIYHLRLNDQEKAVFEVGTESQTLQSQPMAQLIRCGDAAINRDLIQSLINTQHEAYIVVQKDLNRYQISKVQSVSYYNFVPEGMKWIEREYQFSFFYAQASPGAEYSPASASTKIIFQGKIDYSCSGAYLFRKINTYLQRSYTDLVFVPEIGPVEEREFSDGGRNILQMRSVNYIPIETYLQRICSSRTNLPTDFEETSKGPSGEVTFHEVKKGDNLFQISKQYKVSVDDLKRWNNLSSNIIYPGTSLRISSSGSSIPSVPVAKAAEEVFYTKDGELPTWVVNASGTHLVQPGETVASLALKYGYTEARFRYFNDLKKDEFIKIGQLLKTTDCVYPQTPTQPVAPYYNPYQEPRMNVYDQQYPYRRQDTAPRDPSTNQRYNESFEGYPSLPFEKEAIPERQNQGLQDYYNPNLDSRFRSSENPNNPLIQTTPQNTTPRGIWQGMDTTRPQDFQSEWSQRSGNGQPIMISAPVSNRMMHIVQPGDTARSISQLHAISEEQFRALNGLDPYDIVIPGQRLYVN